MTLCDVNTTRFIYIEHSYHVHFGQNTFNLILIVPFLSEALASLAKDIDFISFLNILIPVFPLSSHKRDNLTESEFIDIRKARYRTRDEMHVPISSVL